MADVAGKFFSAKKVRTGVAPSSPGVVVGDTPIPVNPPGSGGAADFVPLARVITINGNAQDLSADRTYNVGTVTSVGLTMPAAFTVANSPVTGAGTIGVTGAGTTAQYIRGDGSLATFPGLTGFVPYTGANQTVNLNTQQLQAGHTTLTTNGSTETLTVNHTSGSGIGLNITKAGNNEGLRVNKTSGSGNAATIIGTLEATTLVKTGGTAAQFLKADGTVDSNVYALNSALASYQLLSAKGQPNGYAGLDSNGKVPLAQINDALIGNVNFQGLWNAATNTPTLANPPAAGTKGYYYIVSTAGTFAGISFEVGDWIISNGSAWGKVDNTDAVSSVFGRTGNVTASNGDYNTSQVTENTNLYFTQARVSANTDVAANTAARHNAVTLGTANGLSLSTQQLSLQLATSGQNGALSSTDWTTFNNKENAISAGTTAQYFRGDKTFQTLNTAAVPELTNLYFTNARAIASVLTGYTSGAGTISAADSILAAIQKLNGNIGALTTGVSSVNGQTGVVTLTTTNIAEGTNLYYTEARVNANANVSANTAARHAAVTLGTANGLGLTGQQLSLGLASAGVTGALSGTDWSTFNSKQNALTNPVTGTGTTNFLARFTGATTIGNSIVFDNGTNVGIGTATPDAFGSRLVAFASSGKQFTATNGVNADFEILCSSGITTIGADTGITAIKSAGSERMRIFSDGNVLIQSGGTFSNNGARLQVSGTATFSNNITITNAARPYFIASTTNSGEEAGIQIKQSTVSDWYIGTAQGSPSANDLAIRDVKNGRIPLYFSFSTGAGVFVTTVTATEFRRSGGTSSQFLKADGSIDSSVYYLASNPAGYTTNTGTVTSVGLSSATSGVTIGATPVTTSGTITLAIATASGSQQGLLSSADWTTFNNKQNALTNPVTGTGTTNFLPKFTGASTLGNSQIFDNGTNVGIGTLTPTAKIHLVANTNQIYAAVFNTFTIDNSSTAISIGGFSTSNGGLGGSSTIRSYHFHASTIASALGFEVNGQNEAMRITSGQNLLVGTTTDNGARLQVSGAATITGQIVAGSIANNIRLTGDTGVGSDGLIFATNAGVLGFTNVSGTRGFTINTSNVFAHTGAGTFSSSVQTGGNVLIPAGSGLAFIGDASRIMTPEDNVSGALIQTPGVIRFNAGGGNRVTIQGNGAILQTSDSTEQYVIRRSSNNDQQFILGRTASYAQLIAVTQNVGYVPIAINPFGGSVLIGTDTSNGNTFRVNGTGWFDGSVTSNGMRSINAGVDGVFLDAFVGVFTSNNNEQNAIQTSVSSIPNGSGFRFQASNGGGSAGRTTVVDFLRDRAIFNTNVGIGTGTPASRLQIQGDASNIEGLVNINNTKSGGGVYFPALKIRNGEGNHSYGIVSEISTGSVGGDRASVLFYSNASNHSWTIGQVTSAWGVNDSFGIGYRPNNAPATFTGWPSNYFAITTGGDVLVGTPTPNGNKLRVNGSIWADGAATINNTFTVVASNGFNNAVSLRNDYANAMVLNSSGLLILNGTSGSSRLTCYGDGFFSAGILTGAPFGSSARTWLLGRFLTEMTFATGSIRVQIGSRYYNIAAQDLGEVPGG